MNSNSKIQMTIPIYKKVFSDKFILKAFIDVIGIVLVSIPLVHLFGCYSIIFIFLLFWLFVANNLIFAIVRFLIISYFNHFVSESIDIFKEIMKEKIRYYFIPRRLYERKIKLLEKSYQNKLESIKYLREALETLNELNKKNILKIKEIFKKANEISSAKIFLDKNHD